MDFENKTGSSCSLEQIQGLEQKNYVKIPRRVLTAASIDAPSVNTELDWQDKWGAIKARWGVGRMDYAIEPGLYALGNPDGLSPVLVSANYKLSFDELRKALPGRDAWILVLDTDGINVWCSAGKGTFGTDELVRRIKTSRLSEIVTHRELILPQLSGAGVSACEVRELSGFNVNYGPIKASCLPAYLDAGMRATPEMRRKSFTFYERMVLTPVELMHAVRPSLFIIPALFLLGGLGPGGFWANAFNSGTFAVLAYLSAILGGVVVNAALLPYVPGRAFSTKGFLIGILIASGILHWRGCDFSTWRGILDVIAWMMMVPALTAYLAMNFTGCSTFTSLSGVRREMRWALPLQAGLACAGLIIWVASRLMG